jgi:hypothetical protein
MLKQQSISWSTYSISRETLSFIIWPLDPMLRHMYPEEGMNVYCTTGTSRYSHIPKAGDNISVFIHLFCDAPRSSSDHIATNDTIVRA